MSEDPENAGSSGYGGTSRAAGSETSEPARRLPPPAFPPGARRRRVDPPVTRADLDGVAGASEDPAPAYLPVPEDAFIQPDEPIPGRSQVPEEAFISPDEPIVRQRPLDEIDPDDVVVTGIGDPARSAPRDLAASDPDVVDLLEKVTRLAESLKKKGEAGLRTDAGMSRFEATLRAYCVGYLAGRRADPEL